MCLFDQKPIHVWERSCVKQTTNVHEWIKCTFKANFKQTSRSTNTVYMWHYFFKKIVWTWKAIKWSQGKYFIWKNGYLSDIQQEIYLPDGHGRKPIKIYKYLRTFNERVLQARFIHWNRKNRNPREYIAAYSQIFMQFSMR